ncbi:MAG TPA: ABC transporter ATP-binding protein [Pedobacter sp.]|nr:ABC transporter ATP-binding protein [Pedobacter sp.]
MINKKYGSHHVLSIDKWEINQGIYWLKGGNGTGKTTLFRIIAGQTPFDGEVLLKGTSLKRQPQTFKSLISYAEAEPQYPLFITGRDLLQFYQEVRKATLQEVMELSKLFEMDSFLDQKIGGYSSGMLKKLSLICAFLGEVELYILDEPLITIDVESARKLYKLICTKACEGKSFLISSHQEINNEVLPIDAIFEIKNKAIVQC